MFFGNTWKRKHWKLNFTKNFNQKKKRTVKILAKSFIFLIKGHDMQCNISINQRWCVAYNAATKELSHFSKSPAFSMKRQQCGIFLFSLHILPLQYWKVLTSLTTDAASLSCILFTQQAFHANKNYPRADPELKTFIFLFLFIPSFDK